MEKNSLIEIWKDVVGYESTHQISNLGRVRVKESTIHTSTGNRIYKSKLLNPQTNNGNYKFVTLIVNNNRKTAYIHRLVAEAFIPNPDNLPCVNHKDEDKTNNSVDNLEWCTYQYNNSYNDKGKRISATKSIPVYQFDLNGNLIKEWKSMKEAGKSLGIDEANISAACSGKLKTYKGFIWKKITS